MINKNTHFHFMGIGGIGMSAIAKILKNQGYKISGCDTDPENKTINELQEIGCQISFEHNGPICKDKSINVLVYSTAVQQTNPEIIAAKNNWKIIVHRATLLAELMKKKYSIAISGSHGKTTTSALISHIFIEAKKDPTVIVGGHLKNISNNARFGNSELMVVEADESDKSIEKLYPTYAVITNIDLEHLETYKNIEDIKLTFKKFIDSIPFYGKAIVCLDDQEIRSILTTEKQIISYGIDTDAQIQAKNIKISVEHSTFDLYNNDNFLGEIYLNIPGKHNVLNSLAAIAISLELDISFEDISKALKNFQGIERRFSFNGIYKGAEIFDDYGHHPNEIINTIQVAKARTKKKLNIIFQPHRFTRTEKLWDQFVETFANYPVDNLIITDIFPASENPIENITSQRLVNDIKRKNPNLKISYIPLDKDFQNIINEINTSITPNDLLLLLGAGKVNKIAQKLII